MNTNLYWYLQFFSGGILQLLHPLLDKAAYNYMTCFSPYDIMPFGKVFRFMDKVAEMLKFGSFSKKSLM
jgi:hypothetical protein